MSNPTNEIENELKIVIDNMISIADEERKKGDGYKDLFSSSNTLESLLRSLEDKMMNSVLDATNILNTKYGYDKVPDEAFFALCALPLLALVAEKYICKTEGIVCSVDKVYYLLAKDLRNKLEGIKEFINE